MIDFTRKAILATDYGTLEIIPNNGEIKFQNTETDSRYFWFSLTKEEWVAMRNFIDKMMDLDQDCPNSQE